MSDIIIEVDRYEVVFSPLTAPGPAGPGVPDGGTTGQVLAKASGADQDTEWVTGGGGGITLEEARDGVASFIVAGDNLTATHDDGADTLTLDVTGLASVATSGAYADLTGTPSIPANSGDLGDVTAFAETLLDDADAASMRATLGLGDAAISDASDYAAASHTHDLSQITDAGTAAALDAPAAGDAAAGEVVTGDDSRLTDDRNPTAHTHTYAEITDADEAITDMLSGVIQGGNNVTVQFTDDPLGGGVARIDISASLGINDVIGAGSAASLDIAPSGDAAANEVVTGDDSRLTDARTPSAHTHDLSEITDSGTAAALDVPASGDAASGEVVKGDDSRLTDARTPTAHTHTISNITDLSLDMQSFLGQSTDADARTALGLGDAAVEDTSAFAAASHAHTESDVSDLKRVTERSYAQSSDSALGTGDAARMVAITQRTIIGAAIVLDASDTGTITIRILNSSGVTQHTATLSVTSALSVTSTSLTWDTGDGTVQAGEIVEVERTSGFSTATKINAPIRFEEDA